MDERKLIRDDEEFPSNSDARKRKTTKETREKKEPIVQTGTARVRKKNFIEKGLGALMGDDAGGVGDYILYDVLIPALKTTIQDMVTGGIEMALFGDRSSSRSNIRRSGGKSYTSYGSYYQDRRGDKVDRRSSLSRTSRSAHNFNDVIFDSRGDAEEILSLLADLVESYGAASVADFYDLSGIESTFTDDKYGWVNLRDAHTDRVRDGYILRLPRPRPLD